MEQGCSTVRVRRFYETRSRSYVFMEARIRRYKSQAFNCESNRYPNYQKWPASQGWSLDGDEIALFRFRRILGGVLLTLSITGCGNVIASQPTTTTSTVAPPVEPPKWGAPTDQRPLYFYASDIPQISRDRVEETLLKATQYWPNYGPLEVWVTGIKTMPIVDMINQYCARRVELKQLDKFKCLDKYRNYPFEEFRKISAIDPKPDKDSIQGELTDTAKYGFHQITLSDPVGFTNSSPQFVAHDQQVVFHEYFHVVQRSAVPSTTDLFNDPLLRQKFFGPSWFSEGSAEYMSLRAVDELRIRSELPLYGGAMSDFSLHDIMVEKMKDAKASLRRNPRFKLKDAIFMNDLSPYSIGTWAIAYLVHKTNPNILLETFYPNIAQLGWTKTFKMAFGMSPDQFQTEFMKFMRLATDEQTKIL